MNNLIKMIFLLLVISPISTYAQNSNNKESYVIINPACNRQRFEGFGVSLSWWANMCGNWSDEKIDEIVEWLVNPEGLNFRLFRYNIGGGDDPYYSNCNPHHMADGKGLRAEMEGFKDSLDGPYIWSRDEAQRKILLKIKEKRPDAVFEAFSNSCPWYMTYSGCCSGNITKYTNNLRPEYYEAFATYLIEVCKYYKDKYDIEFKTISPFNEPRRVGWIYNGTQEGCCFNIESQIEFIKILDSVIKNNGLDISIVASEECYGSCAYEDLIAYYNSGIIDLIGRWNMHTYHLDIPESATISYTCNRYNLPLWVSESGASGKGIEGNLSLAKKIIRDITYSGANAWLDWQYIEGGGDQWCLVQAKDFEEANVKKVKSYYVRSHLSRYIKDGYEILTTLNDNILAAKNPEKDELVIVTVNTDSVDCAYKVDLSMYPINEKHITSYITSATEDMIPFERYEMKSDLLSYTMPSYSIVTHIISTSTEYNVDNKLDEQSIYLIYPRTLENYVLACKNGKVILSDSITSPDNTWKFLSQYGISGNSYTHSHESQCLTDLGMIVSKHKLNFNIYAIDNLYFQLITADKKYLKLNQATGSLYYTNDDSDINTHWGLLKILERNVSDVEKVKEEGVKCYIRVYDGYITIHTYTKGLLQIFDTMGNCLYSSEIKSDSLRETSVTLPSGLFIVNYTVGKYSYSQKIVM